jgi:hypothetical protein
VVKDQLKDPKYGEATEVEFNKDSEALFSERCRFWRNMCEDGVLISIYVKDIRISIYAGTKARDILSNTAREKILSSVKNLIMVKNFPLALESIVGSIKNYFGASENTYESIVDRVIRKYEETKEDIKHKYHDVKEGVKQKYQDVKEGVRDKIHDLTEDARNRYDSQRTVPPKEESEGSSFGRIFFILFAFSIVSLMCFNIFNRATRSKGPSEKIEFHIYAKFLMNLLQDMKKIQDRTILTNHCLLCAKTFEKVDPLTYRPGASDEILKFRCGHLYHRGCMEKMPRFKCLNCVDNLNSTNYEKTISENRQYLSEGDLLRLVDNCKQIYSQRDLDDFYNNYPESRATFESHFNINMASKFGCTKLTESRGVNYPTFEKASAEATLDYGKTTPTANASAGNSAGGEGN